MGRRAVLPKLAVHLAVIFAACGPVAEATTAARSPGATLLVAAWPGEDAATVVAAAGGRVVGSFGPVLVVAGRPPDLALRLWRAGAWLVVGHPGPPR